MKGTVRFVMLATMMAGMVGLTACAKKPSADNGMDQGSGASQSANANGTYGMQGDNGGFKQNSMTAPSNQTYYFGFDQSDMRSQDLQALNVQSQYMANHTKANVRLEGNTDSRGSREYNIALGWRRDQSVARVMEQQGVQPKQIQMVSYGKENPAAQGNDEQAWALNRRVNLIYKQEG